MDIGQALREMASEASLTSVQIAARIGCSEGSVRSWLAGRAIPSGDLLLTLMREFPAFAKRLGFKRVA